MYYYVCMGCGCEWESELKETVCPRCKVGDIYCEEEYNDNQKQRTQEDAKGKWQTLYTNNVYEQIFPYDTKTT